MGTLYTSRYKANTMKIEITYSRKDELATGKMLHM